MEMSVKMASALLLIFLLMIPDVFSAGWDVSYSHSNICALKDSSVIMSCTFAYPTGYHITDVFWTKNPEKGKETPDLSKDPEYSQRLQYLGDEQQNCTIRLNHVTQKDEHMYCFRIITEKPDEKWIGTPGVSLTVTDLQVESPERVTEGSNVTLTCKSSCTLTDRATFIWYRNSQPLTERRDRNNELLLQSVRREDAGRYSCALHGHTYISPAVHLNVTYPPKSISVSISPSSEIMEGDSVTLNCSSDSNPPAEISWFKGRTSVGSGRIYSISKISSDHSGEYKCKSRNEHGGKYSDAVTLNVMYRPRNVSVFINGSAEIVEGDSVTLICSSDSNPPALNFSWFKEDESSAVGSGQSFRARQSGRFYCEAHNQHGYRRSNAVTVTVHGRTFLYAVGGVTGGLGGLIFIFILVFLLRKKCRPDDITQKQDDLYANASAHDGPRPESDPTNQNDALYSLITLSNLSGNRTEGKTSDSEDTEEIQYVTILHHRNKGTNHPEDDENQYDNIGKYQPHAARRSTDQMVEDQSVIYSTVK